MPCSFTKAVAASSNAVSLMGSFDGDVPLEAFLATKPVLRSLPTADGQALTDSISRHWGDRPLEDLQKGWSAALTQFSFLTRNRACALGASYGRFMIDWIAGNWNTPWKCLVKWHDTVEAWLAKYLK